MNKKLAFIMPVMLLLASKVLAQSYENEDAVDLKTSFYMILSGLGFLGVGAIISQVNFARGFGKVISGIGLFFGGLGVVGIALVLIDWAIKTAVTLALFIGGIALVGYIIYQIYLAIFGTQKKQINN